MSILKANCPSCAGPIEFKKGSSIVVVCPFCRSAVARTDRKLEDLGKVAEIVDSQSPLKLGLRGEFNGNKFELTGRAQIKHGAGGFWDEWYATFSNGWVGWLAEAQGKFYMTFYKPTPEGIELPDYDQIRPGQRLEGLSDETHLIVNEKGTATYIAADGEIPYKLNPNEESNYADLVGKNSVFATIDYSTSPPYLFYGKEQTLKDLGLADKRAAEREAQVAPAEAMGCPNCGGTLELKAPDKAERVTCPYCNSLLDINKGNLKFLTTLKKKPPSRDFLLPIGAKGSFEKFADGVELEIIGAMKRSVTYDGVKYYWDEYLLYNSKVGFKWLVNSENHWNFVDSANAAEISNDFTDNDLSLSNQINTSKPTFNGNKFDLFASAEATVEYVKGEFYWRVEQDEKVKTADYISPPFVLSKEANQNEINWSVGTYVEKSEVEKVFNTRLPTPFTVSPNQPFKYNSLVRSSLIMFIAFLLVVIVVSFMTTSAEESNSVRDYLGSVLDQKFGLEPSKSANSEIEFFTPKFKIKRGKRIHFVIESRLDYESWAEYRSEMIPANPSKYVNDGLKVKLLASRNLPNDKYQGKSGEGGWQSKSSYFKSEATGEYQLKIDAKWKKFEKPLMVSVRLYEREPYRSSSISGGFILLFLLFLLFPVILLLYKFNFEVRRWGESDFPNQSILADVISDIVSGK